MSEQKWRVIALTQIILFTVVLLSPFVEQGFLPYEHDHWHFQDNIALLIVGILLVLAAMTVIGIATRFGLDPTSPFSILPIFPRPQRLILTGIYRYIRHPQSLGWLIGAIGYFLILDAKWSWLLWPVCLIFFIIQIPYEEYELKRIFPEYKAYMNGTYRLIPFIW